MTVIDVWLSEGGETIHIHPPPILTTTSISANSSPRIRRICFCCRRVCARNEFRPVVSGSDIGSTR